MSALMQRARQRLEAFATAGVSSRPLGMFRIFATFIIIYHLIGQFTVARVDHHPGAMVTTWVFFAAAFVTMVGYETRVAAAIFAACFAVLHLHYGLTYDWHLMSKPVQEFQIVVLLALTPCGRSLSIDRALEVRRAAREGREPEPERMPWWMLELFIVQICAVYIWAAQDKSDPAWLRGERMERYWVEWYGSSDSFARPNLIHPIAVFLAWSTTVLEYVLGVGLLVRRWRPYLMWGGVALHLGILTAFSVTYFSFMMIAVLMLCLPPHWIHDFVSLVIADAPAPAPAAKTNCEPDSALS